MTLSELADYLCAKVGQTDEDSLAQGKRFLNARLRMIWDSALWRETLCLVPLIAAARQPWLILPTSTERVLKLRAGGAALQPLESAAIFDYAPDLFEAAGHPLGFATFAPVVHGPSQVEGDTAIITQTSALTAARDVGRRAFVEVERADGSRVVEQLASTGIGFPVASTARFIVRFGKETTAGAYQVGFADGAELSNPLGAAETQAPRRPRIRLVGVPSAPLELLALCKRSYPGLTEDCEHPALSNVENALLAYAMADMLERQRQYAKAQLKLQEGQAQMALLHDLERNQTATEACIIPALECSSPAWI